MTTEINGHFCEKCLLFVRDWREEVTTQHRSAILGNRSKKVEKHSVSLFITKQIKGIVHHSGRCSVTS